MKPEEYAKFEQKWKYYTDDAFLVLHVINELIDPIGEEMIREHWPNKEERDQIIRELKELHKVSKESVENEVQGLTEEILRYAGLD